MINTNYYKILNLKNFSSENEIKEQYKRLIKLNHPDKGGDSGKFIEVKMAYEFLLNKELKFELDKKLELEEEVFEKSDEMLEYKLNIEGNTIEFQCSQCEKINNQKIRLNEIKQMLTAKLKEENLLKRGEEDFQLSCEVYESYLRNNDFIKASNIRILIECNNCSLRFKLGDV